MDREFIPSPSLTGSLVESFNSSTDHNSGHRSSSSNFKRDLVREVVHKGPTIKVDIGWKDCDETFNCFALMDTGANTNFIPESMVYTLGIPSYILPNPISVTVANGSQSTVSRMADLDIWIQGVKFNSTFLVFPTSEVVLGLTFQEQFVDTFNLRRRVLKVRSHRNQTLWTRVYRNHTYWSSKEMSGTPNLNSINFRKVDTQAEVEQIAALAKKSHLLGDKEYLVRKGIVIPPMTESRVEVTSTSSSDPDVMITNPRSSSLGTVIKNQVAAADTSSIFVSNFQRHPITLKAGQVVAEGHLLDTVQHFKVHSVGTEVLSIVKEHLELVENPEEIVPQNSDNYLMSHYFQSFVAKDTLRLQSKGKDADFYPSSFCPSDRACVRMMKQEITERMPDYVTSDVHPNKRKKINQTQFDFNCFNIGKDGTTEWQQQSIKDLIFEFRDAFIYSKEN